MRYVLLTASLLMVGALAVGCGQPPGLLQCKGIADCQNDTACIDGQCRGVYGREYNLTIQNASVPEKNQEGQPWDLIGGLPDTYCVFESKNGATNTSVKEDTLSPSWGMTRNIILIKDDPIQFRCYDSDTDGDDIMFSKQVNITAEDIRKGSMTLKSDQGFTLKIALKPDVGND